MADELSYRISRARLGAELTQEQLAAKLGVSLRTLTRYESGETQRISTDTLLRIAKATKQPLTYFLGKAAA